MVAAIGALVVLDVAVISQLSVEVQLYCCFTDAQRLEAIHANNATMDSLNRIIASDGVITFQDEHLGVGGTLGATTAGTSTCRKFSNLFESLRNVLGLPSALGELATRISTGGIRGIPGADDQTPERRAELAAALLRRQQAYDAFLRRYYPEGPTCDTCEAQ